LVLIFIAASIHVSAIASVLILPLYILKPGRSTNLFIFVCSFFVSDLFNAFLSQQISDFTTFEKLTIYLNTESYKSTILPYLYYTIGITNLLFYNRLVKSNILNKELIAITTFGLFVYNLLSFEPVSADRISAFFLIFWIFIIPSYSSLFNKMEARLFNNIIFLILLFIPFFYLNIYINAYETGFLTKAGFLPYKFWFNHLTN
jgi:hypothetical protein